MEAPQDLVDAVSRLKPQLVLVLDTNVIMNSPWLDRWKIDKPGTLLLVIPRIVDIELMSLTRGGKDEDTREKASRACYVTDKLFERGNPTIGIDLGADRWLISVDVPSGPDTTTLEDDLARKILSKVDAALVKLARACVQDCPDTSVLLVTEDRNCRRFARNGGISACRRSDLRSSETLGEMVLDRDPSDALDIEADIAATVNSEDERPVKIAMRLEELSGDDEFLIARGSGRLTNGEERYPFRWTFPYQSLAVYKNPWTDTFPDIWEYAVMPLENVDFMGNDEKISEGVRRFVCDMVEESGGALQSPLTHLRFTLPWHTAMALEPFGPSAEVHKRDLSMDEAEKYDQLSFQHDAHMQSLVEGTAESFGSVYRSVFQLNEDLQKLLGWDQEVYDPYNGPWDLESALINFLDFALDTWSVGETREKEYSYTPYSWLEEKEETSVDDEDDSEEEFA